MPFVVATRNNRGGGGPRTRMTKDNAYDTLLRVRSELEVRRAEASGGGWEGGTWVCG